MIYGSVYANAELNLLPIEARHLYIGTLVLADDDGRLRADPRFLKGQLFSYDEDITSAQVDKWLTQLEAVGQISIYEEKGVRVLTHPKWKEYQRIRSDMYTPSKLPKPVQERTESVTETVHNISKDKVKKDKITSAKRAPKIPTFNPLGSEIIKSFEDVDPKNKTYYGNKTQRASCDFLLEEYGLEQVLKVIKLLPKTNRTPYFPKINSPNDLKERWVKLSDQLIQEKGKQLTSGRGVA